MRQAPAYSSLRGMEATVQDELKGLLGQAGLE